MLFLFSLIWFTQPSHSTMSLCLFPSSLLATFCLKVTFQSFELIELFQLLYYLFLYILHIILGL